MSYIDGLASGLDTTSIIKQLMQVEALPKTQLENKAKTVQAGLDAYASIRTRFSAVRTAALALETAATGWQPLSATSSNKDAVTVSAGTGTPGGSLTFSVTQLASAMQRSSTDLFAGASAALGGRTLTIDGPGDPFTSTATTLDGLIAEINGATDLGVRASAIQVQPGQYRLVLSSADTGADNGFTVAASPEWTNAFGVTRPAQDAQIDVGGIPVTRPTNTITDLVDGATITLTATTAAPVTVSVTRDAKAMATKVKALAEAVNDALGEIKLRTGFNAETNMRSSLTGDGTARSLGQSLVSALTGVVNGSALGSVGLAGVELKRDGTVSFDEAKFTAAYAKDPAAVQRAFTDGATSTGSVTYASAGWRAQAGNYAVKVTNTGGVFSATIDGQTAAVTVNDDGSLKVAMDPLHARLGGLTVQVSSSGLPAAGVTATVGTVSYDPGAAKRLSTVTNRALDLVDGQLTSAEESRKNRIKDINAQVANWELRLAKRELGLKRQYTALETMMGQLANQGQWLSSQISGLSASSK